ncbi:MAG: hypothetical protein QOH41_3418 [Blastocatellia bacterium]|nr:hypothetical protein [Blastocatellia bacterium]
MILFQTVIYVSLLLAQGGGAPITKSTSARPPARQLTGRQPAVAQVSSRAKVSAQTLFDDFNYSNYQQLARHGWIIRTAVGWPGIPGATWGNKGVSFPQDQDHRGNRLLRMTSSTDGTGSNTRQSQICHQRKYLDGTYAARVRFVDAPTDGPRGDQLVESFYTISPLKAPWDPDYSELDFEYLPNGGWGSVGPTLYTTSWRTFSPEPNWKKDNVFNMSSGSIAGWHTLVTQVSDGKVKYFIDGKPLAEHGGQYYPRSLMSINFNLWFIKDATVKSTGVRHYQEDIDWVFHEAKKIIAPQEVEAKVAALRRRSVKFQDTVPAPVPALISPCDY